MNREREIKELLKKINEDIKQGDCFHDGIKNHKIGADIVMLRELVLTEFVKNIQTKWRNEQ